MEKLAIFGVPRSGTSWLGQLFNSSPHVAYRFQPLFSYAFKDRLDEYSSTQEIEQFHRELLDTDDDFVLQVKNISGNKTPDFRKDDITHLVWKEVRYLHIIENLLRKSDLQVIGLIRHPCAVIHSWVNAPKEFDDNWNPRDEWRWASLKNQGKKEAFYGFEKWKVATKDFLRFRNHYPDKFKLQLYERLNENPSGQIQELFKFVGLPFEEQTKNFIRSSTTKHSDDPYSVYKKGKSNHEWRDKLDEKIVDQILEDEDYQRFENELGWKIS